MGTWREGAIVAVYIVCLMIVFASVAEHMHWEFIAVAIGVLVRVIMYLFFAVCAVGAVVAIYKNATTTGGGACQ
jgi:hypothetical protein